MEIKKILRKTGKFHDKYYKHLLLIPLILLILSIAYMGFFYSQNGEFFHKDISLTGGTSVTVYDSEINVNDLVENTQSSLEEISTRRISDLVTGKQQGVIIETKSSGNETRQILENYLGYELTDENSSFEFTGSTLSENFFNELVLAVVFAFNFMGLVVFFLFSSRTKIKVILTLITLITPFLFLFLGLVNIQTAILLSVIVLIVQMYFYIHYNIPSAAVVISAFLDIFMTLAFVNLIGMKMSTAGIVAFLMLIGYSVDTDILLSNKVLKYKSVVLNKRIFSAFQTGITMTLTSLFAIAVALVMVTSFSAVLSQIFSILVIGLSFDILNTWITNASLIKWYAIKKL